MPYQLTMPPSTSLASTLLNEMERISWEAPMIRSVPELSAALGTHVGMQRSRNDDRAGIFEVTTAAGDAFVMAVVCDGVGSSKSGNLAAALAIAAAVDELAHSRRQADVREIVGIMVRAADDVVRRELHGQGTTTMTIFVCSRASCCAANVGDSRVFGWTHGDALVQVSTDDTIENELKQLPGNHEALLAARGLRGRLSQAIGEAGRASADLSVNLFGPERLVQPGVILASDGLWRGSEEGFGTVVRHAPNAADVVRRTISHANLTGGPDNSTVVVFEDVPKVMEGLRHAATLTAPGNVRVRGWFGDTVFVATELPSAPKAKAASPEKRRRTVKAKPLSSPAPRGQLKLSDEPRPTPEPRPEIEVVVERADGRKG